MEKENNLKKWKYIVYQTTNLVNGCIYVGVHQTKDPNVWDHYLGCGCIDTQPCTYEKAKTKFQQAVKEFGPKNFRRTVLACFDDENLAYELEEIIVNEDFLKRPDVYNMVLGGYAGCLVSNRKKVYQYDEFGNYLDSFISYADAALQLNVDYTLISYAVRKKAKAVNCFWSNQKVDKLNLSNYNKGDNHKKQIFVYLKDGSFYKEFPSVTQLLKEITTVSASEVKECCLFGIFNDFYFSYIKADTFSKANDIYTKTRPVYKYDSSGNFVEEYSSQQLAEKANPKSNISKAIRLKSIDKFGWFWGIEKLDQFNTPIKKSKRKVGKYDLNGNLVKTYESATAAEKENGTSVWKVLNGTNQTHKQHTYKYLS